MSDEEGGSSEGEVGENQCGLILGCWDHEKTPTLIRDLEYSVNLVERKCIQLFEELIYYKKYLEELGEDSCMPFLKKKTKKSKNSHFFSGSEPDIAFRKNLINSQEIQQVFEEKFQAKLHYINKELGEAARKIGLGDNIILMHAGDYPKASKVQTEGEAEEPCYDVREKVTKMNFFNGKTQSDPLIIEHVEEAEFSKITRNELELYQKLSRLSMRRRKKKKLKGRTVRFCLKRNTPRRRRNLLIRNPESRKQKSRRNELEEKIRPTVPRRNGSRSPRDSVKCSRENLNESEIERMCKSLNEVLDKKYSRKSGDASKEHDPAAEEKETLAAAIRKTVPFTPCTSTSRSHNVGLNLQQLLSLSKLWRKPNARTFALEKRNAEIGARDVASEEGAGPEKIENDMENGHVTSWTRDSKNGGYEDDEIGLLERSRKVWTSEQNGSPNFRKFRSKYTGSTPEGFLEYHKSTTSQYANGRKSMIKSELKRAYAVGSKIMVSDCRRTDVFEVGREGCCFENASGDGSGTERCAGLSIEWRKVHGSFLNIYRKYTSLKEKLTGNRLPLPDENLESLENEIDYSIGKYKDFLRFYRKFLHLNHRLKSLKLACESEAFEPVTSFSSSLRRKPCSFRPNYSMRMKEALREVQALQEKIRLVA